MSRAGAFCARNLLTNWYARPHFEAYHLGTRDIPAMWAVKNLLGMQEVSWTIRSQEDLDKAEAAGAIPIFEAFLPKPKPKEPEKPRAGTA